MVKIKLLSLLLLLITGKIPILHIISIYHVKNFITLIHNTFYIIIHTGVHKIYPVSYTHLIHYLSYHF